MARFPALIHAVDGCDIAITFPDLPGCLACGETVEAALKQAEAALALHLEGLTLDRRPHPVPSRPEQVLGLARQRHAVLTLIAAQPPKAPAIRVNITVDQNLLSDIDAAAADAGTTRSGFLAEAARRMMGR